MHIPGKPLMRPKNSMFRNTDARRLAYAAHLRREAVNREPDENISAMMLASRLENSVGRTTSRSTTNQAKQRRARRQRWASGDRFAFSRN